MGDKQLALGCKLERSALQDDLAARRQAIRVGGLDGTHEVEVLRRRLEGRHLLATDAQKHPRRRFAERRSRLRHITDTGPVVAGFLAPGRALQEQQRQSELPCGDGGIGRHARGEGMRRVHDGIDAFSAEPVGETLSAAEATDPMGDRRQHRAWPCGRRANISA